MNTQVRCHFQFSLAAALLGLSALAALPTAAWCQTTPDSSAQIPPASTATPAQAPYTPAPSNTPGPIAAPVAPLPPAPTTVTNGDSGSVTSGGTQTAPPPAKGSRYRQFSIGPELGLFLPTDSKTRNRFGDSWFSIGIGIGDIIPPRRGGDLSLDLNVISQAGDNRHAYLIPVGVQYRQALNRSQTVGAASSVVPYIGVSADVVFADVRSPVDDAHSGLRTTGGGSVFVGTSLSTRAFVEARYLAVGSTEHFNLSGFDLSAGFRF